MPTIEKKMIAENNFCVLATCSNYLPNSSLMQYICDESCTQLFMLTLKGSVKQLNIAANPHVSLLIDNRAARSNAPIQALTVYGTAEFVQDAKKIKEIGQLLVEQNGDLGKIASDNQLMVIRVRAEKFLLLDGVNDKSYTEL
ncbi:pyridoxamine 5'-phosphate oxidase [Trichococcus palustris]|uniref:Pyridoxamine 5'-phosphate oxidase n=1 Tax=Trichococcus palustris TaxID=140314 RepID=A0A143YUZ8_9LACT|nr:pyridoxamine 5'-phosphate oxidase family protein [Trichococcus palustris]CZQ99474.1 pyridoxamine 5'-phosphate oxidase [Trichococcus palustris]SFK87568.1 General stress protein 26 [Trichococcus palustris]